MTSNTKVTIERQQDLPSGRLNGEDLKKLVHIIDSNVADKAARIFSYYSIHIEDSRVHADDIEVLLADSNLPDWLPNLYIRRTYYDVDTSKILEVTLHFGLSRCRLTVSGRHKDQVYGKFEQVRRFLRSKRPWYWPISEYGSFMIAIVGTLVVFGAILNIFLPKTSQITYLLWGLDILLVVFAIFYYRNTALSGSGIVLRSNSNPANRDSMVFLLTLIATIVGVIIGIISLLK